MVRRLSSLRTVKAGMLGELVGDHQKGYALAGWARWCRPMVSRGCPIVGLTRERGQASLLLLGVLAALLAGTLILVTFR